MILSAPGMMLYSNGIVFKNSRSGSGLSGVGAMKTTSLPLNSLTSSLSFGISFRQGPQPMNHKLTTTILPCSDFESNVLPSSETPRNSGAGSLKDEPEL